MGFGSVRWAARPTVASRRNSSGVAGLSPPWWAREEVQGREAGGDAGSGSVPAPSWFLQPLLRVSLGWLRLPGPGACPAQSPGESWSQISSPPSFRSLRPWSTRRPVLSQNPFG